MATLYKTDNTQVEVRPDNRGVFTLEELQSYVGGYIELLRTHSGSPMFVNEDGKNKDLAYNKEATAAYIHGDKPGHYIVGNALVCSEKESGGER
jgi:hypothetical protein